MIPETTRAIEKQCGEHRFLPEASRLQYYHEQRTKGPKGFSNKCSRSFKDINLPEKESRLQFRA